MTTKQEDCDCECEIVNGINALVQMGAKFFMCVPEYKDTKRYVLLKVRGVQPHSKGVILERVRTLTEQQYVQEYNVGINFIVEKCF